MLIKRAVFLLILTGAGIALANGKAPLFSSLTAVVSGDTLRITFPYRDFVTPDDSSELVSGEDIAVLCRIELWQKRRLWFDRLRRTAINYFRLSYDRWDQKFVVVHQDDEDWEVSERFPRMDSLFSYLEAEADFRLVLAEEDLVRQSYLAYAIEINYLTMEQVEEITEWLRGRDPDAGGIKSLPDKLLGFLLKSSGLKNRSDLRASEEFRPGELRGEIKFPARH